MKDKTIFWLFIVVILTSCMEKSDKIEVKDGYLSVNGSEVYYKEMGVGQPMIVVHGGPLLDHSYFLPQFEELAKNNRLIFYDQRACGKSSFDIDTSSMSIDGFAEDIELIRQQLNLDKINLLGHSWGGLLASKYAINYPEHIVHLILSNSMPLSTADWQVEQTNMAEMTTHEDSVKRSEIMSSGEMKTNPPAAIKKLMLLAFRSQFHNPQLMDSLNLEISADYMQRSAVFSLLGKDLMSFDLYDAMKKVTTPTLIIYGDIEPAAKISGEKMNKILPTSRLVIIPNSGHFPFIENPDTYFSEINSFVNE